MKQVRFTESQIVALLNEGAAGMAVAEILRKCDISTKTYFKGSRSTGARE